MRILEGLVSIFVNVFGITQPTGAMRRRASWFILSLLAVALGVVSMVGVVLYHVLRR